MYQFFFQLKKDFGERVPDKFPPKKLLSLKQAQLEERREQLEKYLQAISQDPVLVASKIFVRFLLKAQKVGRMSEALCRNRSLKIEPIETIAGLFQIVLSVLNCFLKSCNV